MPSESLILQTKKTVDMAAVLSKGTVELLTNMELQHKNQFEMIITPFGKTNVSSLLHTTANNAILKLYVQTVEVTFVSFAYERADNVQYLKDVEYPESVRMTFLEDDIGIVRNWLSNMMQSIAYTTDDGTFVFQNDQNAVKFNAILIPLTKMSIPSGGWISLHGLKYMSSEGISFDQSSAENMILDVTFACDNCWWKTPSNLFA